MPIFGQAHDDSLGMFPVLARRRVVIGV
eukprot:SAG11_NODE_20200_length_450_cov_1.908832_1_plen_27_part_10